MPMKYLLNNKYIKGVTLIEVLVAIVITSIGILGFASLQFLGINSNQSAYYRSQATFIASDLSERMRANIDGMNGNQYRNFDSTNLSCDSITGSFCDERNNGGTAVGAGSCNAAQRAANDVFVATCGYSSNEYTDDSIKTSLLADLLPNGRITITCNDSVPTPSGDADICTDFSDHTIVVSWSESNEGADANGKLQMSDPAVKSVTYTVSL